MNILFLGLLYDRTKEAEYMKKSKVGLQNAINTFQWNLIDGIETEKDYKLTIYNVLPVGTYPREYSDLFLATKRWTHNNVTENIEIGAINIPIIKQITRRFNYYRKIENWIKTTPGQKNIIIYSLYEPVIDALCNLKKKYSNITVTVIVTDLPSVYGILPKQKLKAFLLKQQGDRILKKLDLFDAFVLLTKHMVAPLKAEERPYVIIEGISAPKDSVFHAEETVSKGKKIVFYSGTLYKEFGIGNLLEAFKLIDSVKYELWIAGSGNAQQEISDMASKDKRIKYLGYLSQSEVLELQHQATVLINPRQSEGVYTKYSFPSKTIEYMMAGKPIIMYKLGGIPDEYDNYLFYVEGGSAIALKEKIIEVCTKSKEELQSIGMMAREFVSDQKSAKVQAKKIIDMIKKMNLKSESNPPKTMKIL